MDLASVVAALASVGVRVSGSTPNNNVQGDSSRACPTGLAGPEPSGTINDPGQHFQRSTDAEPHAPVQRVDHPVRTRLPVPVPLLLHASHTRVHSFAALRDVLTRSCLGFCLPHAVALAVTFRIFTQCLRVLCHLTRMYIGLHLALVVRHALRRTAQPSASSHLHTSMITMARVREHQNAPWDFAHAAGVLMYLQRVYPLASKIPTASAVICLLYACILARALAHTSHTPAAR